LAASHGIADDHAMRVAVIDIGSNTIKLWSPPARPRASNVHYASRRRIGRVLRRAPHLAPDSIERGVAGGGAMLAVAQTSPRPNRPRRTSAVRDAANGRDFAKRVGRSPGWPCVSSPAREADYIGRGLSADPAWPVRKTSISSTSAA
jgi:exopolyphosphatase/pppGpp-phosphohydrolase